MGRRGSFNTVRLSGWSHESFSIRTGIYYVVDGNGSLAKEYRDMALTKPASVFVQTLGATCLFGGLLTLPTSIIGGLVVMVLGGLLLKVGQQASDWRRRSMTEGGRISTWEESMTPRPKPEPRLDLPT
jgi:hypothetical protein